MNPSRMIRKLNDVVVLMTTSNSPFSTAAMFVAASAWQRVSKEFCKMKKALLCSILSGALVCCGSALYAQQDNMGQGQTSQGQGQMGEHRSMPSPEQRLDHLTKVLNLNSDQQQKIKPMLEQEQQQVQTLRQDTSMARPDRMSKVRQIRQTTDDQIKSVLTADQQTKFTEMRERQRERMEQRRSEHGGMGQGSRTGQSQPQQTPPSTTPPQ
jgi:periplasmic protein CpxP/Spy